ncbi:membrane-anchored junction protein isoform X3 [Oryzias latipes]|uniref:membrane-anchored junction protein isoform X3 n=1 Tax=Oryzias latipes TaxID=8090 RepID=UPI0009DA5E68|nr:membrane-anchored junction protein isoform X3 [Oryzias latipes]
MGTETFWGGCVVLRTLRSAMSLQAFSFPLPETRYFRAGGLIYQFKIRGGSSFRDEKFTGEYSKNQELEEMIRTVLGNLERLRPFSSAHYTAFPYRKRRARKCKHAGKRLRFYPFTLLLYLEKNLHCGEPIEQDKAVIRDPSKRRWRNSPLEGATAKDFFKDSELDSTNQHAEPEEAPPAFDETHLWVLLQNRRRSNVQRKPLNVIWEKNPQVNGAKTTFY